MRMRPNPKLYRHAMFNALDIQTNRILSDREVITINYVLKKRAHRYVASTKREWLFPEAQLDERGWFSLGGGDIFMPDPRGVPFAIDMYLGYDSGVTEAVDAYGFRPGQRGYADRKRQEKEWISFSAAKAIFAQRHGPRRRGRACNMARLEPEYDSDALHHSHLQGLKHMNKIRIWSKK
jgi:hypothetical protein